MAEEWRRYSFVTYSKALLTDSLMMRALTGSTHSSWANWASPEGSVGVSLACFTGRLQHPCQASCGRSSWGSLHDFHGNHGPIPNSICPHSCWRAHFRLAFCTRVNAEDLCVLSLQFYCHGQTIIWWCLDSWELRAFAGMDMDWSDDSGKFWMNMKTG